MKWITFLLSLGVCILTTACAHQTNTKRIENHKPNNIGVISLFTDKAKVSRGIGALVADIVYSKDTGWEIDTIVKKSVEQNCGYTGKVYLIDIDLTSIQKKDEEKYDNLAEFIYDNFNKVPDENESFIYKDLVKFTVRRIKARRIQYITLEVINNSDE